MSELKATTAQEIVREEKDCDYMDELFGGVKMPPTQVYLKSEADKVIAHHKYKRCLAMAMWCKSKSEIYNEFAADASEYMPSYEARFRKKATLYQKWAIRWLELAEKFKDKEAK